MKKIFFFSWKKTAKCDEMLAVSDQETGEYVIISSHFAVFFHEKKNNFFNPSPALIWS